MIPLIRAIAILLIMTPALAVAGPPKNYERLDSETSLPSDSFTNGLGVEMQLGDFRGKVVLLNLWATWCAPCVVEMPLLDELAADMAGELQVVTVSEDLQGAVAVVPFFEERDLPNLPQWLDPNNALAASYGGGAVLPLTVLYDAQGKEVWRVMGGYDWASEDARAAIEEGLAERTE